MSESTPVEAGHEVLITRVFEAPREQVFRAWTDPEQVAVWYGPEFFDTRATGSGSTCASAGGMS